MRHHPKPDNHSRKKIKVELYLTNHARTSEVRKAICVYVADFSKKFDLLSSKSVVDKSDNDKLKSVPTK